eukprot:GFUD01105135.1.p1 GENE.GFUD01105135.1~~GFUD01105135.1.p1  ORF type:complete len:107 (+),score=1.76 GFUD01105135.1:29-349(+)
MCPSFSLTWTVLRLRYKPNDTSHSHSVTIQGYFTVLQVTIQRYLFNCPNKLQERCTRLCCVCKVAALYVSSLTHKRHSHKLIQNSQLLPWIVPNYSNHPPHVSSKS